MLGFVEKLVKSIDEASPGFRVRLLLNRDVGQINIEIQRQAEPIEVVYAPGVHLFRENVGWRILEEETTIEAGIFDCSGKTGHGMTLDGEIFKAMGEPKEVILSDDDNNAS